MANFSSSLGSSSGETLRALSILMKFTIENYTKKIHNARKVSPDDELKFA